MATRAASVTGTMSTPYGAPASRPMRVLGLARVSTAEQAQGDRYSIPHQRARIVEFCQSRGWELTDVVEYVHSGGSNQRELTRLLHRVAEESVNVVVVNELDRLARDMITTLLFLEDLQRAGCRFASVTDDLDLTTADGELKMMFLSLFAHYFRKQLSGKVRGGLLERARAGKHHGGRPPYGFAFQGDTLVPVPEEADVVKEIFHHYVHDGWGTRAIAKELNGRSVPKKRGKGEWQAPEIRALIRKPVYVGDLVHGALEFVTERTGLTHKVHHPDPLVVRGAFQSIVDRATWDEAQRILDRRGSHRGRVADSPYLLSGIVRCGLCNRPMAPIKGRKGNVRYVCRGYQTSGTCSTATSQPVRQVEETVLERWFQEVEAPSPEVVDSILHVWQAEDTTSQEQQKRLTLLGRRLETLPSMRVNAEDALLQGLFSAEQYRAAAERLAAEERQIRAEILAIEASRKARTGDADLIAKVLERWRSVAAEFRRLGDVRQKRTLLQRYIRQVTVFEKEIVIAWQDEVDEV